MDGDPHPEPVQLHLPIVALLDMPHTAAFAKASGRRCFKVARTPPITTTSPHRKAFEVIRNLFSHGSVLLSSGLLVSLRFAPSDHTSIPAAFGYREAIQTPIQLLFRQRRSEHRAREDLLFGRGVEPIERHLQGVTYYGKLWI